MKLWKLDHAKDGAIGYDCNIGFVVAAKTEQQARKIAEKHVADEGEGFWLDPEKSLCVEIVRGKLEAGVILDSFNAG